MLDFFTYNTASRRAGIVNLNTRNGPVLASIIRGALLHDLGSENPPTALVSRSTTPSPQGKPLFKRRRTCGGAWSRVDPGRCCPAGCGAAAALPTVLGSLGRSKADDRSRVGRGRSSANLEPDDRRNRANREYTPGTADISDPTKFIVEGEKRYWLHIALDRDNGTVLGTQLEEVLE